LTVMPYSVSIPITFGIAMDVPGCSIALGG
jgi:hypothetical protein